jgi:hypothetical protein
MRSAFTVSPYAATMNLLRDLQWGRGVSRSDPLSQPYPYRGFHWNRDLEQPLALRCRGLCLPPLPGLQDAERPLPFA